MKTKIDSTGRVYIPREIRERVRANEFTVEITNDGSILLRPINVDPVEKYYGIIKGEHASVEDMEKKIKKSVKEIYEK